MTKGTGTSPPAKKSKSKTPVPSDRTVRTLTSGKTRSTDTQIIQNLQSKMKAEKKKFRDEVHYSELARKWSELVMEACFEVLPEEARKAVCEAAFANLSNNPDVIHAENGKLKDSFFEMNRKLHPSTNFFLEAKKDELDNTNNAATVGAGVTAGGPAVGGVGGDTAMSSGSDEE